ncbi:MAG: hypothetical protein CVU03_09035 [Bacteroidetes bacterium HGW-Bacteroidetes-2]|nr:MAG: hypothetical protein CVU03_09035 [Bacteroidetes bacterium HGW-Bacteroidetes-2]
MQGTHTGLAKWRVQCFYDSLVQGSSLVFQMNFCAKNPPLRQGKPLWCIMTEISKNQHLI